MKYEVTDDTIIIKYIADGKYKKLELNKNDEIDLDFFGQLIKAKNNKQDAMCDLYAKEVLSYEPSPERITNMNLTKIDEPSEYTKKEAAKLRIEELKRDLELIEKKINAMLLRQYQHKKIEELKVDYLDDKSDANKARLYDLIDKYNTIKQSIDKEQKIYDVNTKKEILPQDEFMKKITNEFESKLNKVVGSSDERRQIMDDVIAETTPKNEITQELRTLNQIIDTFETELEQRLTLNKPNYLDVKSKRLIKEYKEKNPKKINSDDSIDLDSEEEEEEIDIGPVDFTDEDEKNVINDLLQNDDYIKTQKQIVIDHINYLIQILEKTNIETKIIESLVEFSNNINIMNANTIQKTMQDLIECLKYINEQNDNDKIIYTQQTVNRIIKSATKIITQQDRIETLFNKKITEKWIQTLISRLPTNTNDKLGIITNISTKLVLDQKNLDTILNKAPGIFIWKQREKPDKIYSNSNLFGICTPDTILFKGLIISCFYVTIAKLKDNYFSLFNDYITTEPTNFQFPLQTMDLYLNLKKITETLNLSLDKNKFNITYHCFVLNKSPISNMLKILMGQGEGIKNKYIDGGKIDLDKADTEDKLSEIVRLLQNISYNLFTLTPNYEESEKNKRLKSKGVDLKELFK